jgi:hypothetical protein
MVARPHDLLLAYEDDFTGYTSLAGMPHPLELSTLGGPTYLGGTPDPDGYYEDYTERLARFVEAYPEVKAPVPGGGGGLDWGSLVVHAGYGSDDDESDSELDVGGGYDPVGAALSLRGASSRNRSDSYAHEGENVAIASDVGGVRSGPESHSGYGDLGGEADHYADDYSSSGESDDGPLVGHDGVDGRGGDYGPSGGDGAHGGGGGAHDGARGGGDGAYSDGDGDGAYSDSDGAYSDSDGDGDTGRGGHQGGGFDPLYHGADYRFENYERRTGAGAESHGIFGAGLVRPHADTRWEHTLEMDESIAEGDTFTSFPITRPPKRAQAPAQASILSHVVRR